MQRPLSYIVISTILAVGFVLGCTDRGPTTTSGSSTQTGGEEGIVAEDVDGKAWVTPDVGAAEEEAQENAIGDADEVLVEPAFSSDME